MRAHQHGRLEVICKRLIGWISACRVIVTYVKKVEAMFGRPRVNLKVESGSTVSLLRCLSYILFTRVKITRQRKSTYRVSELPYH